MKLSICLLVLAMSAVAVMAETEEQLPATPLGGACGAPPCPPLPDGGKAGIEEAIQPVDEWIKGFRKQMGMSENLYNAARCAFACAVPRLARSFCFGQSR